MHLEECCDESHANNSEQSQSPDTSEHNCITCYTCYPKSDLRPAQTLAAYAPRPVERKELVNVTLLPEIYIEGPSEPPRFLLS